MSSVSDSVTILGARISRLSMDEALIACDDRARQGMGGYVCFANVHSVTESMRRSDVRRALNEASLSVADGMPLVWSSRIKRSPVRSRVCGPDFMAAFIRRFPQRRLGFLGGKPGQATEMARRLGLDAVCYSPPMRPFSPDLASEDWEAFVTVCGDRPVPDVVWVGLGAPKQELWMNYVSRLAPKTLFLGVGAAFDLLAGHRARAPQWMQRAGMEWLYRLNQEPGRLWRRYLYTNTQFVYFLARELLASRE